MSAASVTTALVGCGAGQVAQTALGDSSVSGLNTGNADGSVLIRNLAVAYHGTMGYPQGADAPLELHLFNQTSRPITVQLSSQAPEVQANGANVVSARSVALIVGQTSRPPAAEPSAGAAGSPVGESARIELEPLGRTAYRPGGRETLKAVALSDRLAPGNTLNLTFTFSNGAAPLTVQAPIATPLSPVPRTPEVTSSAL